MCGRVFFVFMSTVGISCGLTLLSEFTYPYGVAVAGVNSLPLLQALLTPQDNADQELLMLPKMFEGL